MDITREFISREFDKIFQPIRSIKVYTGAGGYDQLDEVIGEALGYYRVYLGKKFPRILRTLKGTIHKSATGRYYKIFKK